jgi:hypothetical protein
MDRIEGATVCRFICVSSILSHPISRSTVYIDEWCESGLGHFVAWAVAHTCMWVVVLGGPARWCLPCLLVRMHNKVFFAMCSNLAHGKLIFFIITIKTLKRSNRCKKL